MGAEGPKNIAQTVEIGDGWLPLYSPYRNEVYADSLCNHVGPDFEITQGVVVSVTDDVEQGLLPVKGMLALYVGGMGAKDRNFHKELIARFGFEEAAEKIQELYLAGRKDEAMMAVPDQLADEISLVGPKERIRDRLQAWRETPITSLLVSPRTRRNRPLLNRRVLISAEGQVVRSRSRAAASCARTPRHPSRATAMRSAAGEHASRSAGAYQAARVRHGEIFQVLRRLLMAQSTSPLAPPPGTRGSAPRSTPSSLPYKRARRAAHPLTEIADAGQTRQAQIALEVAPGRVVGPGAAAIFHRSLAQGYSARPPPYAGNRSAYRPRS